MDTFRSQRSLLADRFLGLFAAPPRPSAPAGDELHEDDVFWIGSEASSCDPIRDGSTRPVPPAVLGTRKPSRSLSALPVAGSCRISLLSSGILAALSEDDEKRHPFVHRKAAVAPSPPSAEASPVASARMIPVTYKKNLNCSLSIPAGKIYQHSAPVNVPAVPPKVKKGWVEFQIEGRDGDGDEYEMLPPHEIVARASGNGPSVIPFSVLEGVGRTLKGRDLRRVRNAVLQKTGFLD
ncbi:hypothetical protein BHE74_00024054 [Ensete ventricosum]|nr:hypothetical protein GW17_00054648 [Ensete ventricosum]RWW68423.1 hypothetical protein BHE74_00024054 [Ensete ventricosum]